MDAALAPRATPTRPAPPPEPAHAAAGMPIGIALLAAAAAGLLLDAGFPDRGWWPLSIAGTALLLLSLRGRSLRGAMLVGAVGGFVYYGALIEWLTVYLGLVPWLALTIAQVLWVALGAVPIALAWRWLPRAFPGGLGRLVLLPVVLAAFWMLRESVANVFPWGGFAWGRLAVTQAEGPLAGWAGWVGMSGLTFLVALVGALLAVVAVERRTPALARAVLVSGLAAVLLAWPAFPTAVSGTARVAAVQGDSEAGLFAARERGAILQDHYDATRPLFDAGEELDLVVWPENASDIDPLRDEYSASVLDVVTRNLDAPLIVGTITQEGEETFNSALLWRAGEGSVDQYDKIHPVPFAEYLPERDFFYPLAPDLFDLVPRDYSFGQRDTILDDAELIARGIVTGIAICYDIVDDDLLARMIDEGATLIAAPTNNADFGRSDQNVQQLAIARLRAIEQGRSVVQASTVGASAIIGPDGRDIDRLPLYEAGSMVAEVPLSSSVTPAHALGRTLEFGLGMLALTSLALAAFHLGRAGRRAVDPRRSGPLGSSAASPERRR
jgi:apolipoprotein N-acyltransferase